MTSPLPDSSIPPDSQDGGILRARSLVGTHDSQVEPPGLTTSRAPFIEQERHEGHIFIEQPYELYSEANHEAWRKLFSRLQPRWDRYANDHFLAGIHSLCLDPTRIPRLNDVNRFLQATDRL